MRRLLSATLIVIIVTCVVPLFFLPLLETSAISDSSPFIPHEVKVLVVSPANMYFKGGHYLIADLARYGFNVTQHTSDNATFTNYVTDSKTSNLGQYDVVILHGSSLALPPAHVSMEEVDHFANYGGILIVIGSALFRNETTKTWWQPSLFTSMPIQKIEQRLGVDFTDYFKKVGAAYDHNNGTFTLIDSSIKGLPQDLAYLTTDRLGAVNTQFNVATNAAQKIFDFTTTDDKTTGGVTYYKNLTSGAVGIYIQGSYIYATSAGTNQINYFGLTDISKRSALLASLIAFALEKDIDTIIKPQPLANIRLDGVGQYYTQTQTYLNTSLSNFNSAIDAFNITPTAGFIDFLDFKPSYWQTDAPKVLSQLKGMYRDWEYSTSLRYYKDPRSMTKEQIETLIDNIKGNYSMLGMDLFSTVIAPGGRWNQSTLDAMVSRNLHLIDILDTYYSDWWRLRVNSSVIVHSSAQMLPERVGADLAENFTQPGLDKNSIHYKYVSRRDKWALAVVNGFPSFVYYVPNFRWNEVGTYSLRTVCENLTSEIPDIRFVPLIEAGLYFGNEWIRIKNPSRVGSAIEFDVETSAIPSVVSIGKGMLWLRINANESIQEVSIDNNPWFYFDDHSIRMPASVNSSHVKVTLGVSSSPRVVGTRYKVVEARYDGYRLSVSISSTQGLNVSVGLFLPQVGPFLGGNWSLYSLEDQWSYKFDVQSRILEFWAISDGFVTFELGVFYSIKQTPPWYNSSVTVTFDITDFQIDVLEVILSYYVSDRWFNFTMRFEDGVYVAEIPMMPYGTVVDYRVFILDIAGHSVVTEIVSYNVIDMIPPEVGVPAWNPLNPDADEPVSVNVSVTEPENASGVDNVALWYYLDDILGRAHAKRVDMIQENGVWSAVIPGQSGGAFVIFFVRAYDKSGRIGQTSDYSYSVAGGPALPFQIVLLGVGLVVGIGLSITLYFTKFRKSSVTHETLGEKKLRARR